MNAHRCRSSADEAVILLISIALARGSVMLFLSVIYFHFSFVSHGVSGKALQFTPLIRTIIPKILNFFPG